MKKLIFLIAFINMTAFGQQLAFPTATGAGAYTTGGRGGKVIHVTTLEWAAEGGLKAALKTVGPRIIVLDVSGEIIVTDNYFELYGQYDNFTLAGQSAPLGGITIRSNYFSFVGVNNFIIRYVRFRNSNTVPSTSAVWVQKGSDYIFDHVTFSHGRDECFDNSYSEGASGSVTVQHCFFQDSQKGVILGVDSGGEAVPLPDLGNFTFRNNVFMNISHRFPNPQGNGQYDIINNIIYNWRERLIRITQGGTYNIVNNYYKPANQGLRRPGWYTGNTILPNLQKVQTQAYDHPLIYTSGSIIIGQRNTPQLDDRDMFTVFAGSHLPEGIAVPNQYFTTVPFPLVGKSFEIKTAYQAYADVLNDVGANAYLNADGSFGFYQDTKDSADIEVIRNDGFVSYSTNDFVYTPIDLVPYPTIPQNVRPSNYDEDRDGMADAWELARFGTLFYNGALDADGNGYTEVEDFLNGDTATLGIHTPTIISMDADVKIYNMLGQLVYFGKLENFHPKSGAYIITSGIMREKGLYHRGKRLN